MSAPSRDELIARFVAAQLTSEPANEDSLDADICVVRAELFADAVLARRTARAWAILQASPKGYSFAHDEKGLAVYQHVTETHAEFRLSVGDEDVAAAVKVNGRIELASLPTSIVVTALRRAKVIP